MYHNTTKAKYNIFHVYARNIHEPQFAHVCCTVFPSTLPFGGSSSETGKNWSKKLWAPVEKEKNNCEIGWQLFQPQLNIHIYVVFHSPHFPHDPLLFPRMCRKPTAGELYIYTLTPQNQMNYVEVSHKFNKYVTPPEGAHQPPQMFKCPIGCCLVDICCAVFCLNFCFRKKNEMRKCCEFYW